MKKLALVVVIASGLSGCVVYPAGRHHDSHGYYERERPAQRYDRDRDRDGVPNRHDRYPGDRRWY